MVESWDLVYQKLIAQRGLTVRTYPHVDCKPTEYESCTCYKKRLLESLDNAIDEVIKQPVFIKALNKPTEPPFDGKPCLMCDMRLRNLHSCAHNLIHGITNNKIASLMEAVEETQILVDEHFANRRHSHGENL